MAITIIENLLESWPMLCLMYNVLFSPQNRTFVRLVLSLPSVHEGEKLGTWCREAGYGGSGHRFYGVVSGHSHGEGSIMSKSPCSWPPYFTSCSADLKWTQKFFAPLILSLGNIWLFSSDPRGIYFLVYSLPRLQRPGSVVCKRLTQYAFGFQALAIAHFPWLMAPCGWGLEVMEEEPISGELGAAGCGIWELMNKPATIVASHIWSWNEEEVGMCWVYIP